MRKRIACVTAAILSISLGVSGCGLIPFEQDIPFLSSRAENVETEKKTEQQTIDEQDADTEKSTEDTQQDDGLNEGEQTDNEDTEEADEKQENPMEQAALMAAATQKTRLNAKTMTLQVGQKKTLKVKNAGKKAKLKWSSNKKSIATVSKKGVVKAVKAGNAVVTCKVTTKNGKTTKLTCKVAVKKTAKVTSRAMSADA